MHDVSDISVYEKTATMIYFLLRKLHASNDLTQIAHVPSQTFYSVIAHSTYVTNPHSTPKCK